MDIKLLYKTIQVAVLILVCTPPSFANIKEIPLPLEVKNCFENAGQDTQTVGEVLFTRCVQRVLWKRQSKLVTPPLNVDAVKWIASLVDMNHINDVNINNDIRSGLVDLGVTNSRQKRQADSMTPRRQPRIRKEYRQLSDVERNLFHRAINMLKADTSVLPNKYDALGRLHYLSVGKAHFGPSFLPWHRLFLVVMENALREKIPSVTIPYWDTTLDDELKDPRASIIWTPEFLGSANGYLIDGPFANWDTPFGPLIRQFGLSGTMLNWTFVHNSFRQNHLEEISTPYALPDNNLEEHHNQVHLWVGGHMTPPALAAFDPVFYLLHSYVDLLWEIFRGLQRRRNIDPTVDYPMNNTEIPEGQRYNDSSGFGLLKNRHGLSDVFTDNIYKYDRPPSCSVEIPDCGSPHLRCDTSGSHPKCVTASIFDIRPLFTAGGLPMNGGSGIRELRSTSHSDKEKEAKLMEKINHISDVQCEASSVNGKVTNTFTIDGVTDEAAWAYIPVKVMYRNSKTSSGKSAPVYDVCKKQDQKKVGSRVILQANGINYNGLFKEVVHFRNTIEMDSTLAYIGVRKPTAALSSEVIVSAYDSCGRMCQPFCLDKTGKHNRKCTGAIDISKRIPLLYGSDVASVVNQIWREDMNGLPTLHNYGIFMTFVCDTTISYWPWSGK